MKTVIENESGLSKYVFDDADSITITEDLITTPTFVITDLNSGNATVHENVTPPADWTGCKYTFDGTTWAVSPYWVDPEEATTP